MSEEKAKPKPKPKNREELLQKVFEEQPDEINIFDPKEEGEMILGKVADYGISKEFKTPFLVLINEKKEEITVFIKMGIIPKMRRKKWITIDDTWNEAVVNENIGKLIAFQYVENATSERTRRQFQKYKILFSDDLEKVGILDF